MKTMKTLFGTCRAALLALAAPAAGADLVAGFAAGRTNETLSIPVRVQNAASPCAAAALTLTFDTAALEITVESGFFGTFAEEYARTATVAPRLTAVTVDGVLFTRPLVTRPIPGAGLAVAGAKRQPAAPGDAPLFTLNIRLKPGAAPGLYPVGLSPTVVHRTEAGYPPAGAAVPLLLGRDRLTDSWPVVLDAAGSAAHLFPGSVRFSTPPPDLDQDGLGDAWETLHFANAGATDGTGDADKDGLSDGMEYLLGTDPRFSESSVVIRAERSGDDFRFFFPRRNDTAQEWRAEWGVELTHWFTAGLTLSARPDLGSGPDWTMMEARVPAAGQAAIFGRITEQRPPPAAEN